MSTDRLGTSYAPDLGTSGTQLPIGLYVGMAANADPIPDDVIALNASGYGVSADTTSVGLRIAGIYEGNKSAVSVVDGGNKIRVINGFGGRMPMSATSPFLASDHVLPAYLSARREVGKASSAAGVGLPLVGLMLGLDTDGTPITWIGDLAQAVARAVVVAGNFRFAGYEIVDAAASTAISEQVIGRVTAHGVVESVDYTGAAFAANNTDYATGTIAKRGAADSYAAATTIATFDSRAANQGASTAFTPYVWALSGTAANLRLIPGDVLTLVTTKPGAGKSLIGFVDVVGKVI